MTLQQFYSFLADHRPIILLLMLLAPWLAWVICAAVPGKKEEPFVLSCNLTMAMACLLLTMGYMWYAASTGGTDQVVREVDILLVLAPCYYVGVSLWVTRQRLPLSQVPAARAIQGFALICAGYLGLTWLLSKLRIVLFSFLPAQFLLLILLGLLAVGYMGYQRIMGTDGSQAHRQPRRPNSESSSGSSGRASSENSVDDELEALRRDLDKDR